jgi:hypothetical protein
MRTTCYHFATELGHDTGWHEGDASSEKVPIIWDFSTQNKTGRHGDWRISRPVACGRRAKAGIMEVFLEPSVLAAFLEFIEALPKRG